MHEEETENEREHGGETAEAGGGGWGERYERDDPGNCGEIKPVIRGQQWVDSPSKKGTRGICRCMAGNTGEGGPFSFSFPGRELSAPFLV